MQKLAHRVQNVEVARAAEEAKVARGVDDNKIVLVTKNQISLVGDFSKI